MDKRKRAALVGAVCAREKGSLTAVQSVLTAAGVEVCAVPIGVESVPAPSANEKRDLSRGLPRPAESWMELDFDAAVFGLPVNEKQMEEMIPYLNAFRGKDHLLIFSDFRWGRSAEKNEAGDGMLCFAERLCAKSDLVILPIEEIAELMGEQQREGPWDRRRVEELLRGVCSAGAKSAVATGVWFSSDLMGSAAYSSENGSVGYAFSHWIDGIWPGSGDLFSASLISGLLHGLRLSAAMQLAVDFTADCIRQTKESGGDGRSGLSFKSSLPKLMNQLG